MHHVFLSLGSNVGNREANLKHAVLFLKQKNQLLHISSVYETAPWGNADQANFLNQIVEMTSDFKPAELLVYIKEVELEMGREPDDVRYQPRVIDIDILFYEHIIVTSQTLMIPHPHIHERRFILVPMVEIAPKFVHPVLGRTMKELLERCVDNLEVKKRDN
jgi:2-amino-4-hydroxy-6-hydroxymethyldihydropteridine diphosphokinase